MSAAQHKPRMLVGMPMNGAQTAAAGRALWRAARDMDPVYVHVPEGSLPTQNFNRIWCVALNAHHRGQPFDYVAMLHSDVGAEDWWLDRLIAELEAQALDVLAVAVPIKDASGATSLALDRDGDTWRPLCRLTLEEIYRLPPTFTSADVGAPFLVNTGCFVCRFDMRWAQKLRFTVNDRIVFNEALDCYMAEVEPEDWFFSRLCHELGLRVGATSIVAIEHRGPANFTNTRPWGQPFDTVYTDHSLVPPPAAGEFRFPHDVPGWLSYREGRALRQLARDKRVLEIGSYFGRSTICLAQSARQLVTADPHDGRATPMPTDTLEGLQANLARYEVADRVEVIVGTFAECDFGEERFELVFIDGAHDYQSVQDDIGRALAVLAPAGLLLFHDYHNNGNPGVDRAIDELLASGATLLAQHDSLAVVRPAALIPLEV